MPGLQLRKASASRSDPLERWADWNRHGSRPRSWASRRACPAAGVAAA